MAAGGRRLCWNMAKPELSIGRFYTEVITREKRVTQYSRAVEMKPRSRGVLDYPAFAGMTVHDVDDASTRLLRSKVLRAQRLLQISDQIFLVLDADRQPHNVGCGARLDLRGIVELTMRRRCRVNHQRAGVADIGEMREQFQVRHQVDAGLVAALEAEGEHGAGALRRIFAREVVVFVPREPGVIHRPPRRMPRSPLRD